MSLSSGGKEVGAPSNVGIENGAYLHIYLIWLYRMMHRHSNEDWM
jgi:hypothetical protein